MKTTKENDKLMNKARLLSVLAEELVCTVNHYIQALLTGNDIEAERLERSLGYKIQYTIEHLDK